MNTRRANISWRMLGVCILLSLLAACSGTKRGGYYKDDGPDANPPGNLDQVPDAVPKIEPLASGANKPYVVFGRQYVPDTSKGPYKVQGRASWYGKKFHANSTSNGERYDMYAMTAAHTTLPIPSYVRVTRVSNGKSVVLRVNDRGPFHDDRIIDLSYVAAYKLGMLGPGSTDVVVERITDDQIRNWNPSNTPNNLADSIAVPAALPIQEATPLLAAAAIPAVPETRPLPPPVQEPAPARTVSAQPAPSTQMPPGAQVVPSGSMFLQLGAFSDASKAQSLAARITAQMPSGLNAPVLIDRSASNLYRVRIGPFASRDAAVEAVMPIQSSTGVAPSLSLP
jgi:rare lipoprotein A